MASVSFRSPRIPEPSPQQSLALIAQEGSLTAAEREVLRLVTEGLDNRAIADRLFKSEKTVRNQVSIIFDKLGVRTRAEASSKREALSLTEKRDICPISCRGDGLSPGHATRDSCIFSDGNTNCCLQLAGRRTPA